MMNINFDDGYREVSINGDSNRKIRFNPTDLNFYDKFMALYGWFQNKETEDRFKQVSEELGELEKTKEVNLENFKFGSVTKLGEEVNEKIDYVFGEGVSKVVFGTINPLSPTTNGSFIAYNFIEAILPLIKTTAEKSNKASEKYIKQANKIKSQIKNG